MNLVIDVGNSLVKLAVFEDTKIIYKKAVQLDFILKHVDLLRKEFKNINKTIISSVGKLKNSDITYLKKNFNIVFLDNTTTLPFKNCYKTPHTLGVDRLALVSAAVYQYPKRNVLIIDAGTCITYDFITRENQYLGGAISPGIRLRYKSLHNLTANLPLLDTKSPKNLIGTWEINFILTAAPPLASPSALVKIIPERLTVFLNSFATDAATCPVNESATKNVSVGLITLSICLISLIICKSI